MITAVEATKLMRGLDPEALKMHLGEIEQLIISEAKKNKNSCTIRKEPYISWASDSFRTNETAKEVERTLKEKGFEVKGRLSGHDNPKAIGVQITWSVKGPSFQGLPSADTLRN